MGLFSRRKKDPVLSVATAAQVEPSGREGWIAVKGVGEYQSVLAGRVPRIVDVELMPWERGGNVTVRLGGSRVGEIWCDTDDRVFQALQARREAGLPNLVVSGEVRRGDYVRAYLAIDFPDKSRAVDIAPAGWVPRIPEVTETPLYRMNAYADALTEVFVAGTKLPATVKFDVTPSGKYKGEARGVVSVNGLEVGELAAPYRYKWEQIQLDQETGVPGDLSLSLFAHDTPGKFTSVLQWRRRPT